MAAVEHGAKLPVLNMPDVLRDPVAALAGREVPVTLLQQRATSFLQRCHVCLAPESARHARGTRPADSQPTLLFHASDRQPPCGAAITRGHVYWASRSAALYAQRHAYEYAFIDTSRPVAELVQAQAKRPAMPVHFPFAVVAAQFSKSALLLALAMEGPWKQLMYLDDDAGFVSPMLVPTLPAIFGGVSTHLCSGKGVSIDELATSRSLDGTTAVIKSLYYDKMHPLEPQVVSARVPRLMLAAAQPNVWDGSLKWCSACAARARHWPLRGWVDDCPVNSGMVLVGTCPAAQHLLAAWSALSPANGECAAMINWRPSINASVKEAEDIARTPTDLRQEGHPLRVCPCSVRCKDQHALNSLLEHEFLGSAIVVNDALVNGKLFADGSTPKYIQHVWCGSGHESSKEVCSKTRNATAFSWLGEAAEDPGLDELVPRAISWKEALLLTRTRSSARTLPVQVSAHGGRLREHLLLSRRRAALPARSGRGHMSLPPVSPPLARLLYRSLLRTSARGKRPECLPMLPSASTEPLPQSPSDVLLALREHFVSPATSDVDPFAVLRSAYAASAALHPDGLPVERPAFVLPGHTLLPGEHASFVFFEPRYRRLCELALHGQPPDGRFVHLATPRLKGNLSPVGTLVSILRHEQLEDGRYVVECLAGPRVEVAAQREERLPRGEPLLHATLAPYCDERPARAEAEERTARCAELLLLLRRGATGRADWGGTP